MKKVSKAILIGLGGLLVLGIIALAGLNLYVQSPGAQARIQEELSKALRLPLKLTNTSVTPWSDLRITGITIPNAGANFLEAASFTARYRLLPLLHGKLIITEMTVESPKIVWVQNADGKWKLPEPEEAAAVAVEETKSTPPVEPDAPVAPAVPTPEIPSPETPEKPKKSPQPAAEKVRKEKKPAKPGNFDVLVNRFEIKNGTAELLDKDNQRVATFSEVNVTYTTLTAERVEGMASIGKVVWEEMLTLENLRSPFRSADNEFTLPEITATLGGGSLRGRFDEGTGGSASPFKATFDFDQINLARLMTQPSVQPGQAVGKLSGQFEMHGDARGTEKAEGSGHLDLRDGQFKQLEVFQNIGGALGIRELSDFRLKDGHADIRVGDEKIYVDNLVLSSLDLQLSAKGTVRFDKKVSLAAQLSVEDSLLNQLPEIARNLVRGSFATAENNRKTIDFNVTGTTDKLKNNLLDKLIGQKINAQFGDLLSNLFGGDRKPDDEKKKKEDEERKKVEKKADKERKKKEKAAAAQSASAPANQ